MVEMAGNTSQKTSRVGWTIIGLPATGIFGFFCTKVIDRWGVLDEPANQLGDFLRANVSGSDLALFSGFVIALCAYLILLWIVWRRHAPRRTAKVVKNPTTLEKYEGAIKEAAAAGLTSADGTGRFYPATITRSKGDRDTGAAAALGYAVSGDWEHPVGGLIPLFAQGGMRALQQPIETFRWLRQMASSALGAGAKAMAFTCGSIRHSGRRIHWTPKRSLVSCPSPEQRRYRKTKRARRIVLSWSTAPKWKGFGPMKGESWTGRFDRLLKAMASGELPRRQPKRTGEDLTRDRANGEAVEGKSES